MEIKDKLYIYGRKIMFKELQPLWKVLDNIDYALIKGEALSYQIYGVPDKRRSSDIDILIEKKNLKFIEMNLQEIGFIQKTTTDIDVQRKNRILCLNYSHQVPSYYKEKYGVQMNVDINFDIFWGEYEGQRCEMEKFLEDTTYVNIYGMNVKVLCIKKAFVQLILHHYKDINSLYHLSNHMSIRTQIFTDVYDIIRNNSEILTVNTVKSLCEEYNIGSIVYYMIYYTEKLYKDKKLTELLYSLQEYMDNKLIDCYGLNDNERKKWTIPFEKRLNNASICDAVKNDLTISELQKIKLENTVFT